MTARPRCRAACSSRSCYKPHSGAFSCPHFAIQLSCEHAALAQHQQPQKLIGAVLRTKVYTGSPTFGPKLGEISRHFRDRSSVERLTSVKWRFFPRHRSIRVSPTRARGKSRMLVVTGAFQPLGTPSIPSDFAPFGIANIDGFIYVTYAKQKP